MTECYSGGCTNLAEIQVGGPDTDYDAYLKLCPPCAADLIAIFNPDIDRAPDEPTPRWNDE